MALSDRLTYLRAEREMTQRELAEAASIGVATISRIENGGYVPQAKTLQRLARALGVTGWVRNRADGRVEAVFEGDEAPGRRLVEWCHNGPSHARVQGVAVEWESPTGEFAGFAVRPTHREGA